MPGKYPKEDSMICPQCGAESGFPAGCVAKCGWIAPWTLAFEARRKEGVKKAHGPRTRRRRTREEIESPYYKP